MKVPFASSKCSWLSSSSPDADDSSEAAPDGGAGVQHEGGAVEAVIEVRPHGPHQRAVVAVHVLNTRLSRVDPIRSLVFTLLIC